MSQPEVDGHPGPVDVSVTIPAYNEAARLPAFLRALAVHARTVHAPRVEFVVSDDGSAPDHARAHAEAVEEARELLSGSAHRVRLVQAAANGGKGSAIRLGWEQSAADARWLGFLDADGAVGPEEFFRIVPMLESLGADLVAGSRVRMAGRTVSRELLRHLRGRVFATVVSQAFDLDFYDTQCGLKLARAEMVRPLLHELRENNWMLDIELILQLRLRGARCVELPVDWVDAAGSKVHFGLTPLQMLWSVARLRRRLGSTAAARPSTDGRDR